jgi:signal transduction histidine kinase
MEYFTARDSQPAEYCRRTVVGSDIYVGIVGLRYGSPVADRPDLSYTELEFAVATDQGLPRLIFLLDESAELPLPATQIVDLQYGARQMEFRRRLRESGLTMSTVSSPAELELRLFQALGELAVAVGEPPPNAGARPVGEATPAPPEYGPGVRQATMLSSPHTSVPARTARQRQIFIAHAHTDREWVQGFLIPALSLSRSQVLTREAFRPGLPIVDELAAAITDSRFTVLVLTEAFMADDWTYFDEVLASPIGVNVEPDSLISILLEPCRVPAHVDLRIRLDCTDQLNWDRELRRLRDLLRRPEPRHEVQACPYPGMRPFRPEEAHLFHGRDVEIGEMARRLRHQSFLYIIGPSGVGKSSLVLAGLVPLLRTHPDWMVRQLRPGGRPMESLTQALADPATGAPAAADPGVLVENALRDLSSEARLLLVVDQLEEAFVQVADDERSVFLSVLASLCQNPRCILVVTMRADFYPELMTSELWSLARNARVEITPLRRDQLREAIVRPASKVGAYLEPALTERLLADAAEEPGALPLVQETLVLLWEQRQRQLLTLQSYENLGGDRRSALAVALAIVADGALTDLTDTQRRIARRIFLRLVQFGEGRDDTRRQQSVGSLRAAVEPPELFDATLLHLARKRVVTLTGEEDVEARKVDLSHERLISGWATLRRWLDEDRDGLRLLRQLERDADEWQRFGRDSGVHYRGARLQAAGEWMDHHPEEVTELERAFLVASRADAASQRIPSSGGSPWHEALTEADLTQLLYAELHPVFGYDIINLQVLEREGWYHSWTIDRGVLQDLRRSPLAESYFANAYQELQPRVFKTAPGDPLQRSRGAPPTGQPRTVIWLPLVHAGRPVGSISYQLLSQRRVPPEELAFLERIHTNLGLLVSNAYLNELTRNQAVSLGALNTIARALSVTHDEEGVVNALMATLSSLIPVDRIELAVRHDAARSRMRMLEGQSGGRARASWISHSSRRLSRMRLVMESGVAQLHADRGASTPYQSLAIVPILELGSVRGALTMSARQHDAYEQSTLTFLQQVADQVVLALRNVWSYDAIESQRRRLEIANAVGRRLATSLDRWSIMRILREELARHLVFDVFTLATLSENRDGTIAQGYVWDSGQEVSDQAPVRIASAGPAREAYNSRLPVLIRRAPWARPLETRTRNRGERVVAEGMLFDVTRPDGQQRVFARSVIWVPVCHGEDVTALLSLQAYRADMFDEWHVQVLQDVATQVGLVLANAEHYHATQMERVRLTALHMLELGVTGAANEAQIAKAFVDTVDTHIDAPVLLFASFDARERVSGYCSERDGRLHRLESVGLDRAPYFSRLLSDGITISESVPPEARRPVLAAGWPTSCRHSFSQILLVPIFDEDRVAGALSALRTTDVPFRSEEIQFLESASPVVGNALRTVRLQESRELVLRAIGKEVLGPAAAMRSAIAGLLQWDATLDADEQYSLVEIAYEQSDRLLRFVEVQLLIAQLETGRFTPRPVPVALTRSLKHVLFVLRPRHGQRVNDVVDVQIVGDLPDAYCEPIHLDQVLANLVANALDHTPATVVRISALRQGGMLEVAITDDGGGLAAEQVDHLFSKHVPVGPNGAIGRIGLGLYLCHLIVEHSFGGRIWLESTGGSGTTFRFTVPLVTRLDTC